MKQLIETAACEQGVTGEYIVIDELPWKNYAKSQTYSIRDCGISFDTVS
jgi:hypothetical protein